LFLSIIGEWWAIVPSIMLVRLTFWLEIVSIYC
jgi:hypothetical protein